MKRNPVLTAMAVSAMIVCGATAQQQPATSRAGNAQNGGASQAGSTQSGSAAGHGQSADPTSPTKATPTDNGSGRMGKTHMGKSGSSHFVMEAAQGGMAEVELGTLATQKASNSAVKQFGQRMVDDHSKANDELKSLAASKNVKLPMGLKSEHKALRKRLSGLSGAAFDRAYMQAMVQDHQKDVAEFQKESQQGDDPEVKAFAAKTLPTLQEHLKMAQQTLDQVK